MKKPEVLCRGENSHKENEEKKWLIFLYFRGKRKYKKVVLTTYISVMFDKMYDIIIYV